MLHPIILSIMPTSCEREYECILYIIVLHIIVEKVINFFFLLSFPIQVYSVCIVNKIHNIETLYTQSYIILFIDHPQ